MVDEVKEVKPEVRQMSLDNILDEAPPRDDGGKFKEQREVKTEEVKTEVKPEVKAETKPEAKKEPEVKKEPPKQDFSDKERAFQVAALDERRKRQEAEGQREALKKELSELKAKETAKPFWDAPEEALAKQQKAIEERMAQIENKTQAEVINTKLGLFEAVARSRYTDFDSKINEFAKIMESNPHLHREWLNSPDPAEYAYQKGKNSLTLQEAGSIDNLRSNMEKELRIKIESELKEKEDKLRKEREEIPGSLSGTRGMTQSKTEWTGPTSLDSILKD